MKTKIGIIFLIFTFGLYSCGSKKKELRQKYDLEKKEEKKKKKHKPTLAERFAENINSEDLATYVYYLSDDRMEGRQTGRKGQKKAAKYIWDHYMENQILFPKMLDGYYQQFTASKKNMPEVVLETDRKAYQYGKDLISFFPHDSIHFSDSELIFAGYGIDDYRYSDYSFQDVKGKIVLIAGGEPRDKYGNFIMSTEVDPYTGKPLRSKWSKDPIHSYILKRNAAMKHGAKALLIYDPVYQDYYWKNFQKHFDENNMDVTVKKDSVYDFFINKDIFTDLTGYDKPEDITYTKKTRKFTVPISISYKNTDKLIESENVIGILEGDEKNDQYIIIISHYDGMGKKGNVVYNSANDNATGVAAGFEITEAFQAAIDSGYVPRRNIAFINFSGKEQKLLGSRYYIDHPVIPLEKTMAVIELNRLGRLKNEDEIGDFFPINISFSGFNKKGFKASVNNIQSYNDHMTVKFKPLVERSDYNTFMDKQIPTIHFFGAKSVDNHKPDDKADRISYEIMEKRTRFIFQIIWELAYQKKL